jgi:hypothetical protein
MSKSTCQESGRHGEDGKRSRWSRTWRHAVEIISHHFGPAEEASAGRLPDRVADLLADPEAGERLLRLTRWLVVGAVLVVAFAAAVLIVHPEILTAFASRPHSGS